MPSNGNSSTHLPSLVPKTILGLQAIYLCTTCFYYIATYLAAAASHDVDVDGKDYTCVPYCEMIITTSPNYNNASDLLAL